MKKITLLILTLIILNISVKAQDFRNKTIEQLIEMKKEAVANENYELADKIKEEIIRKESGSGKLENLKKELAIAIENEDYDKAAEIKEQINNLDGNSKELEKLKNDLKAAIQKEDYDKAAVIKEKITAIENGTINTVNIKTIQEDYIGNSSTFQDSRDQKEYKWVKIGTQIWMAENLAYKSSTGYWIYNNNEANLRKYGYLYNWETAKNVCPQGYHLPSDNEWEQLAKYINDTSGPFSKSGDDWKKMGPYLKLKVDWKKGNGTDDFDFAALPGGFTYRDKFAGIGNAGLWWSSDEMNNKDAWRRYLQSGDTFFLRHNYNKSYGLSVRCVKD